MFGYKGGPFSPLIRTSKGPNRSVFPTYTNSNGTQTPSKRLLANGNQYMHISLIAEAPKQHYHKTTHLSTNPQIKRMINETKSKMDEVWSKRHNVESLFRLYDNLVVG